MTFGRCPSCGQHIAQMSFDDITISADSLETPLGHVLLSKMERQILCILLRDKTVEMNDLIKRSGSTYRAVKVHISHLRDKITPLGYNIPLLPNGHPKKGIKKPIRYYEILKTCP